MSENTDTAIGEPTAEDYAALTESSSSADDDGGRTPEDNEAARYRHRLRAAEAERDAVAGRLEVMQRGEAERLAASKLADPQDLWRDGAQLADVVDDSGRIDADKLNGLIGTVLEAHKHWARMTHPAAAPASEVTANGRVTSGTGAADSFEDAFRPRGG